MQQQQKIQQLNSQTQQQLNQDGQRYSEQNYGNQGYSNPQVGSSNLQGAQSGASNNSEGTTTAPRPGNAAQPINPLATYENQLRQLDNQYNNTLQQLDRNPTTSAPRAQY